MKLNVLTGGQMRDSRRRELLGQVGDFVQLIRRDPAKRDLDPDHVAVVATADSVNAVFQAETPEIVRIGLAGFQLADLFLEPLNF